MAHFEPSCNFPVQEGGRLPDVCGWAWDNGCNVIMKDVDDEIQVQKRTVASGTDTC